MKKTLFTIALVAGTLCAKAQQTDTYNLANAGMTFLTIPVDARSAGMGDLGVATTVSNYAHQHNAAKYLFADPAQKGGISLGYTPWLRKLVKDMNIASVSGFYRIDDLQTVSASFRYFSMGDLRLIDDEQIEGTTSSPYELAVDLAYSRKLGENFAMSLAMRYGVSDIARHAGSYYTNKTAHVLAFDLTAYYRKDISLFGQSTLLGAGFAVKNIGSKLKYGEDNKLFLPGELKLGANLATNLNAHNRVSLGLELGKYLVSADPADADKSLFSGIAASFNDGAQFKEIVWQLGAEYGYNEMLFLRAGYFHENEKRGNRQYVTFGAGVAYKSVHLDGSYLVTTSNRNNPLENTFRLSLSMDF